MLEISGKSIWLYWISNRVWLWACRAGAKNSSREKECEWSNASTVTRWWKPLLLIQDAAACYKLYILCCQAFVLYGTRTLVMWMLIATFSIRSRDLELLNDISRSAAWAADHTRHVLVFMDSQMETWTVWECETDHFCASDVTKRNHDCSQTGLSVKQILHHDSTRIDTIRSVGLNWKVWEDTLNLLSSWILIWCNVL